MESVAQGRPQGQPQAAAAASFPGLVLTATTCTRERCRRIRVVDRRLLRLRRMQRGVKTAARLMTEGLQRGGHRFRAVLVTVTYRPGVAWEPGHIRAFLCAVREWLRRQGGVLRNVWTLELTKAGVPHYHVVLWLPRGVTLPKPDVRGWWPHGMTSREWARKPVGYIAKYASKGDADAVMPAGARLHGCGGLGPIERIKRRWWLSPEWVRDVLSSADDPRRVRGGFQARSTGELLLSPWVLLARSVDWRWLEVGELAP